MGEIKSTMDIIMEKTKNLTMTEEEKKAFKRQEMEGKVKGLVQKFIDGVLDKERLRIEVTALQEKDKAMIDAIIREESLARIELGEDNEPLLEILGSILDMNTKPIREMLDGYEGKLSQEREARERLLMKQLEKQGISGSAVVPNLEGDSEWKQDLLAMKRAFKEEVVKSVASMENTT
jgi:hypothetical protein